MIDRLVSTRTTDGGVSVRTPSPTVMRQLTAGGGGIPFNRIGYETEKWIAAGEDPDIARLWCLRVALGGCTDAEAYELFRRMHARTDCVATERFRIEDLPRDRWFRDAWHRSANGGPIVIDMAKARRVQAARLIKVRDREIERYRQEEEIYRLAGLPPPEKLSDVTAGLDFSRAETPEELRAMWPAILPTD